MNKMTPIALGLLCAALAAAAVWQSSRLRETRHDLKKVKERVAQLETRQGEMPTREEVATIEKKIVVVERKVDEIPPPAPAVAAAAPSGSMNEERLKGLVDERIEKKLEGFEGSKDDRKMPLETLSEKLKLDPVTRQRVAEIADATKKEIFNLLLEPRPDGTTLADEIIEAYLSGDPEAVRKGFVKLLTEKIPRTDSTYLAGIAEIQQRGREDLARVMTPEAYERYLGMNVHPENIQTGYEPWGEYARQKGLIPQ
jgi:hypothetical protein